MSDVTSPRNDTDVLIIGSGIMGSAVARLVREQHPDARITMVDGGSVIGETPGLHLHESTVPEIAAVHRARTASGIQSLYLGEVSEDIEPLDSIAELTPGLYDLVTLGEDPAAMPGSALAWNVGGMGVHWTASAPWPAGAEVFDFGDPEQWDADLEMAKTVLNVHPAAIGPTPAGQKVLETLDKMLGERGPQDRRPQVTPMAAELKAEGLVRTGPSSIFPPLGYGGDPAFTLRPDSLAVELLHEGDQVLGTRIRTVSTGELSEIRAAITVVCADVFRTPQLLFASGIRPPALGRYLNEHPFITSQVLMDLEQFEVSLEELPPMAEGEWASDALWLPQNDESQPFHGQVYGRVFVDDNDDALAYGVAITLYTPVQSRAENRIVFSETELDIAGLPKFSIEFDYSEKDLALIEAGLSETERLARAFGEFDPDLDRAVLTPGSSLHQTGTVRMGSQDDGTSVCNASGLVWGFENLYVAGNGAVPTPLVCNSTLTGMVTAVRAARAVSQSLATTQARQKDSNS